MKTVEEQKAAIIDAVRERVRQMDVVGALADQRTIATVEAGCRSVLSDLKARGEIHPAWGIRVEMDHVSRTLDVWFQPPLDYIRLSLGALCGR